MTRSEFHRRVASLLPELASAATWCAEIAQDQALGVPRAPDPIYVADLAWRLREAETLLKEATRGCR